jgi:hypothetical protein
MSIFIPQGSYTLPICLDDPDAMREIVNAMDLWRRMHNQGVQSPTMTAVLNAVDTLLAGDDSPCVDCDCDDSTIGACFRMDTSTEIFDFYPNDPFDTSDTAETSIGGRWRRFADILELENQPDWIQTAVNVLGENVGYFPNDCFVSYTDGLGNIIPTVQDFWDFINNLQNVVPFPTVTIKLEGTGQAEIEFPILPFGGRCIIFKDFEPELNDILDVVNGNFDDISLFTTVIELERDLLSSTPEFIPTTIAELEFEEDGSHTIRCVFIPTVEPDQAPFLFPFGGIRELEFCGNLQVIGSQTGNTYNKSTYRNLEAMRRNVIMSTVQDICEGMICAMEKVAQRILLANESDNIRNSIEIDKDTGQTVIKTSSGLTRGDFTATNQEAHYGGVHNQAKNIGKFLSDIKTQATNGFGNDVITSLQSIFLSVSETAGVSSFVSSYVTSAENIVIDAQELAVLMYCKGINAAMVEYAAEHHTGDEITLLLDAFNLIPQNTLDLWYEEGTAVPRDGYQLAACHFIPTQEFVFDIARFQGSGVLNGAPEPQAGNRIKRVEITGQILSENGRVFDGFYYKGLNGDHAPRLPVFAMDNGSSATFNTPTYNPDGGYVVNLLTPATDGLYVDELRIRSGLGTDWQLFSNPTGSLTVRLIDVGQA